MTGDQNFYLALVGLILGSVSAIVTAILTYLTNKSRTEAKQNMQENRQNLGELAKAVNGKAAEATANARLAGMLEGARLEKEAQDSDEARETANRVMEQAALEARLAALKSSAIAHISVDKILEVPSGNKVK